MKQNRIHGYLEDQEFKAMQNSGLESVIPNKSKINISDRRIFDRTYFERPPIDDVHRDISFPFVTFDAKIGRVIDSNLRYLRKRGKNFQMADRLSNRRNEAVFISITPC